MTFLAGAAICRWCHVDMLWNRWMLCTLCQRDAVCWKCGEPLREYQGDELCDACYPVTPFVYKLVKKGRGYGTVAK